MAEIDLTFDSLAVLRIIRDIYNAVNILVWSFIKEKKFVFGDDLCRVSSFLSFLIFMGSGFILYAITLTFH